MNVESVEALLITLLIVVPGGLGDAFMRSVITPVPPARSVFAQLLSALSWSVGALAICEVGLAVFSSQGFGDFLIKPLAALDVSTDPTAGLAWRYALFVLVALVLPGATRQSYVGWLSGRRRRKKTSRTPSQATLDAFNQLVEEIPRPGAQKFALVETANDTWSGWVSWRSTGEEREGAYILRSAQDQTLTWIPNESVLTIRIVDPDLITHPRDFVIGWPDGDVADDAPEVVPWVVRIARFIRDHGDDLEDLVVKARLSEAKKDVVWRAELEKIRDGAAWPSVLVTTRLKDVGLDQSVARQACLLLRDYVPVLGVASGKAGRPDQSESAR